MLVDEFTQIFSEMFNSEGSISKGLASVAFQFWNEQFKVFLKSGFPRLELAGSSEGAMQ